MPALAFAASVAVSGCNCGAQEQRALTVSSASLTLGGDGAPRQMAPVIRLTEVETDPSSFRFVFNTIEGSASGEGIALSISGTDPSSDELVALTLALPVSLRRGEEYPVGGTFAIEPGVSSDPQLWGPHDLAQPNRAEVAFTIAAYTFPPPLYTTKFRAVTSSGTIRVTDRQSGWVALSVNLSFVDANGRTRTLSGNVQATTERVTPPCIS